MSLDGDYSADSENSNLPSHLGPFVLTTELLGLLTKTAKEHGDVRIINVRLATITKNTTNTRYQVASEGYKLVPDGITFSSSEDFNIELGGTDDIQSNLARYA